MRVSVDELRLGVFGRELEGVSLRPIDARKAARVGHHVPGKAHSHVRVTQQTFSIVPKVILGRETFVIKDGILPTFDDLVPKDHLIELVVCRLVLSSQVNEELLHVPIEEMREISLQIPAQKTQVVLRSISGEIGYIFHK